MFSSHQKWAWVMESLIYEIYFREFARGRSTKIFSLKNLAPYGLLSAYLCIQIQVSVNIDAVEK